MQWIELKLPRPKQLVRFLIWIAGRLVIGTIIFHVQIFIGISRLSVSFGEQIKRFLEKALDIYDAIPFGGVAAKTLESKVEVMEETLEIQTDILELLEGKHALICGGTGEGKSTLAQYLAALIGGQIKAYDPDAAPDEWRGIQCIGREGNFEAIDKAMQADIEDLNERLKERGRIGDSAFIGREVFMIAEEFPLLKDEVPSAIEWLLTHARRGRKPKRFVCILSQESEVKALGLEGQGGARKNLLEILTNREAIKRAKKLKNCRLEQWLRQDRSRILCNEQPVQLPALREIQRTIQQAQPRLEVLLPEARLTSDQLPRAFDGLDNQLPASESRSTPEGAVEDLEALQKDDFEAIWAAKFWQTFQMLQTGATNYKIGKEIFSCTGGTGYQKLCQRLDEVRSD